ncbi:MAG: hypothetical protein KDA97_05920 [Acidimicrobiales bacterium]|nr:hypothetical protein [Acidimicrobiales bacterium]
MLERTIVPPHPVDLLATLSAVRRGTYDPTCRFVDGTVWRASRTAAGTATLRLVPTSEGIEATAWGDGAELALEAAPALIGCDDDASDFAPEHPLVARLWRHHPGLRIGRTGAVTETLVGVVLEQRVTTYEARRAQSQLVERWGEPAPGPGDLLVSPDPEVLADVAYYDLHVIGVERKRADAVRRVAAQSRQLDALVDVPIPAAATRLSQIQGIGPWSVAYTTMVALGDTDAVPLGDVHLPMAVTHALTGEAVDDDDAMVEALAPFAGHRARVIRLIMAAGLHGPRSGPRYAPRDIRDQ